MEKYFDYDAEDFASSESFQNWYFKRNEEDIAFWEAWLTNNRLFKQSEIEEAIGMLRLLEFKQDEIGDHVIRRSWVKLKTQLDLENTDVERRGFDYVISRGQTFTIRKFALGMAAVISLLILSTLLVRDFIIDEEMNYKTGFGETISLTLPDNSTVTLNSNSSIRFMNNWRENMPREVWLDGEAYFSVVHTPDNDKFYVKTSNGLRVEVLGTEFNVTKRKSRTRVVLNSGKIKLNIESPRLHQELIMEPGELVEFKDTSRTYVKKVVNPELYTSWRCNKLMFEKTPLKDVVTLLEENYGLEVEVSDPELLDKEVSGSVPNNNTNLLMEGLSESFNLDIVWSKNHVTIKTR